MTRWIGKKLLGRMALLAGAVALVVVLLLPKEPLNRLPCYGWQAKEYYYSQGGVAVPVEGERARQTIRRFFQEARYETTCWTCILPWARGQTASQRSGRCISTLIG